MAIKATVKGNNATKRRYHIQLGKSDQENAGHHDETNGSFPEQAGDPSVFAIT
jgi:hypothetical protein